MGGRGQHQRWQVDRPAEEGAGREVLGGPGAPAVPRARTPAVYLCRGASHRPLATLLGRSRRSLHAQLLALLGGQFKVGDEISGAVLSVRRLSPHTPSDSPLARCRTRPPSLRSYPSAPLSADPPPPPLPQVRYQEDLLSVWNKSADSRRVCMQIRDTLRQVARRTAVQEEGGGGGRPASHAAHAGCRAGRTHHAPPLQVMGLPYDAVMEYKKHTDSMRDNSSYRNANANY